MALQRVPSWLDERAGSEALGHLLTAKVVPRHRYSVFYYLGGMALFLFMVQIGTGLLLLLYYEPGVSTAYESVKRISGEIPFGWLIRSIHRWSADIFIGVLAVHMFTAFLMKAYRRPRELTWLTGVARLRPRPGLRLLGVPAALGRDRLLRDLGGDGRGRRRSLRGPGRCSSCCAGART